MKFKQLPIGARFEFDHSGIQLWSGAVGPWEKLSKRTYTSLDKHNPQVHHVGTINVDVIPS